MMSAEQPTPLATDCADYKRLPKAICDREIDQLRSYAFDGEDSIYSIDGLTVRSAGELIDEGTHVSVDFEGEEDSYQIHFLIDRPFNGGGIHAVFRAREWASINYFAIGYTRDGKFHHIKIPNARQEEWIALQFGANDLANLLQNDFTVNEDCSIQDLKVYLKGNPGQGLAHIDVLEIAWWLEAKDNPDWLLSWNAQAVVSDKTVSAVYNYLNKDRSWAEQAELFLRNGTCPLSGKVQLDWDVDAAKPKELDEVNSHRFSWHALQPVLILMTYRHNTDDVAALYAARDFLSGWLESSYFRIEQDRKYAWYDHGTAERLIAMLLIWEAGLEQCFDLRFMSRLRLAVFRHAQLLASESFYASHQRSRYHNHAWFQDLALIATAQIMRDLPSAKMWQQVAIERLTDQFDHLIVRDNGYAILTENSIGYHHGVQRIVEFAAQLVSAVEGLETSFPDIALELDRFSRYYRYPDGRAPSQGDTFRKPNAATSQIYSGEAYQSAALLTLPNAGYVVVKANHDNTPFMLTMVATALNATHKHQDDLSFTLFFEGIEWLIDPSFYSHEYTSNIPAYLRSAAAHNCVSLRKGEYRIFPGHASITAKQHEGQYKIKGQHSAYAGSTIFREISGSLDNLQLNFVEEVQQQIGSGQVDIAAMLSLHCGEGVRAAVHAGTVTLSHPDSRYTVVMRFPVDNITVSNGLIEQGAIRGIVGQGFLEYQPIDTVEVSLPGSGRICWDLEVIPHE